LFRGRMRDEKIRIDYTIGRNIKMERNRRGISREEFAAMLDLSVAHLGLIERGERGATNVVLERVSRVLEIPIDDFFIDHSNDERDRIRQEESEIYRKKVLTLTASLDEFELIALVYCIKGLLLLRNSEHEIEQEVND